MIKYLGSKRKLIPDILKVVQSYPNVNTVLDLFSGTSRIGYALKQNGYKVISNDYNQYAHTLAICYVEADDDLLDSATKLVKEFNSLVGIPGYFTQTFCINSRYFQPKNGEKIDAIREEIERKGLDPELKAVLLTSLMEAADRVDSTVGLQMAYLKSWSKRSYDDLELRVPKLLPQSPYGKGEAYCLDAFEAAKIRCDLVYLDPPYNQHSYLGNYHIWETLVKSDKPEVYGIACKRVECKQKKSVFNSKPKFVSEFSNLLSSINSNILVISFNNEGYITKEELTATLENLWGGDNEVKVVEKDYSRHVGAKIGIYNLEGEKVGKVGKLKNKEYIFSCKRILS